MDGRAQSTITWQALQTAICGIFRAAGSSRREADLIARHLVEANLCGHDSHGVGVVPRYIDNVLSGDLILNQTLSVALDTGGLLICDGGRGAGQVMAHDAMAMGIARAHETGSCIVSLRDSHHMGRIGHWAEQCAAADLVSVHFVNVVSVPAVAPFGGTRARLGTNPFSAGFPGKGGVLPIIVDFATSQLAVGKVRVAREKGEEVPLGTLLDSDGRATTDPAALFSSPPGSLLPFGGHKGSGLALVCELLAAAVVGATVQSGPTRNAAIVNSMLSVIIDPAVLGTADQYAERLDALSMWISSQNRDEATEIKLPGVPEQETKARRIRDGVPVDALSKALLEKAAAQVGLVDFDLVSRTVGKL